MRPRPTLLPSPMSPELTKLIATVGTVLFVLLLWRLFIRKID